VLEVAYQEAVIGERPVMAGAARRDPRWTPPKRTSVTVGCWPTAGPEPTPKPILANGRFRPTRAHESAVETGQ